MAVNPDHIARGRDVGGRTVGEYQGAAPERVEAFKRAFEARKANVQRVQDLRRSSAASPVNRTPTRGAAKRRAIKEQE